jgi:hypothetical protein
LGEKVTKQLESIPLSKDTLSRLISDKASNFKEYLIAKVKATRYYSIQLFQSNDVSNIAHLLTFIRFEEKVSVKETYCSVNHFLPVLHQMTFLKIRQIYEVYGIEWKKYIRVCSDGAGAMTEKRSGFVGQIKEVDPDVEFVHCSVHREALAARKVPAILKTVLTEIANFIKPRLFFYFV